MDTFLFTVLHGFALQYPVIQGTVIVFARLAIFAYPLFLIRFASWKHCALQSIVAAAIAYGINALIAVLLYRERPFREISAKPLFDTTYLFDSFPSDHAALAIAIAGSIFLCSSNRIRGIIALTLAFAIGLARVMAGVHYVSDVIGGFGIGLFAASISAFHYHWYRKRL